MSSEVLLMTKDEKKEEVVMVLESNGRRVWGWEQRVSLIPPNQVSRVQLRI